ncbi:dihydrolipoyl dehydrogenase [uncultured Zhongshania sp.]|uniref:dihydrolipoyl dehydrogenase n=1 Tax=uncultured Zhongshania sp. TaxID=1642288 RepID=UPI0025DD0BED|nr:dihydrolipoyl dehydrogenase [uncultured Zhongshania sp.]
MKTQVCDVLVVGGGPGGYVAAIRAGQLGLKTILVEGQDLGGTCLNRGCIPSKALIYAASQYASMMPSSDLDAMGIKVDTAPTLDFPQMVEWKNGVVSQLNSGVTGLLKRAKVNVITGWASFNDAKNCVVKTADESIAISSEHVILATGSVATELAALPFSDSIISSAEALNMDAVPDSIAIVGGGYIGLEMGTALTKLGCKVTIVEGQEKLLALYDEELTKPVHNWLVGHGVAIKLNSSVVGAETTDAGTELRYVNDAGKEDSLLVDKVLVTVGRRPNTLGWGIENMCLDMNGPYVNVDKMCRTAVKNVWAIGDLIGEPMLAHKASAQGEMVAEIIAGKRRSFDPVAIPAVCFTEPEIVACGLSPSEAETLGYDVIVSRCSMQSIGKAHAMGAAKTGGFVRITARKDTHEILGIHAVGKYISELSGEFVLALEMGARLEDLAHTIHMHPTLGEATFEAAIAALGAGIHC